jgi:large subunit ribosomal protein L21
MKGIQKHMEYAIILFQNQQLLVKPGSRFAIPGDNGKVGDTVSDAKVLVYKDKDFLIGTPYLDKKVDLNIVALGKTDKITVFKYKAKSRYRRKTGHRQNQIVYQVAAATAAKPASVKKSAPAKAKAPAKTK